MDEAAHGGERNFPTSSDLKQKSLPQQKNLVHRESIKLLCG
jgi:hypothetical protein